MAPFLDLANHSPGFCSTFRMAKDRRVRAIFVHFYSRPYGSEFCACACLSGLACNGVVSQATCATRAHRCAATSRVWRADVQPCLPMQGALRAVQHRRQRCRHRANHQLRRGPLQHGVHARLWLLHASNAGRSCISRARPQVLCQQQRRCERMLRCASRRPCSSAMTWSCTSCSGAFSARACSCRLCFAGTCTSQSTLHVAADCSGAHDVALAALRSADDLRAADDYRDDTSAAASASSSGFTQSGSRWNPFALFGQQTQSAPSPSGERPRRLTCFSLHQAFGGPGKACHSGFKVRLPARAFACRRAHGRMLPTTVCIVVRTTAHCRRPVTATVSCMSLHSCGLPPHREQSALDASVLSCAGETWLGHLRTASATITDAVNTRDHRRRSRRESFVTDRPFVWPVVSAS